MPINQLKNKIKAVLWEVELDQLPKWQRTLIKLLRIFQAVVRDLSDGLPTLRAMSLVYTTLLSIIPLLAVTFSILKGFGLHHQIEPLLSHVLSPLGDQGITITNQVINFVDNIDVKLLGVMGIVLLIYTVISLINKIERAFNHTWHITEYRGLVQRITEYLSVIMIGPILILTALTLTAAITSSTIIDKLSHIEIFSFIFTTTGNLLPYLLVITAFTVLYQLLPNTRVNFRSAFTGAFIAGILWETTGWLFASFVVNSSNYTVVYSSFAILILFMIWIYLSWLILLIGAAIAYYHQHPEKIPADQRLPRFSNRMKEKIALLTMYYIGKHFHENKTPWTLIELADALNISSEPLAEVLHALENEKLITRQLDHDSGYLPCQSLENITLVRIFDSVRRQHETGRMNIESIHSDKSINDLLDRIEHSVTQSVGQLSLRDLITHTSLNLNH